MDTALTAWRNGAMLLNAGYFTPAEVESYRALYIQEFDIGCSAAMKRAAEGNFALMFAIEDAEIDKLTEEENA